MSKNNVCFNKLHDQLVNLARILHQETMLLSKREIQQVMKMQKQKNNILEEINKYKDEIKKLGEQYMSENIKEIIEEINNISKSNSKIINREMIINEKIMKLITQDPQVKFYGPHGLIIEDSSPIALKDLI